MRYIDETTPFIVQVINSDDCSSKIHLLSQGKSSVLFSVHPSPPSTAITATMEIDCATTFTTNEVVEKISTLSLCDGDDQKNSLTPEKDPRTIARKYQMELCKRGLEENIIACLGTGAGKTHIAVLIMHAMAHLIKKPQRSVCVFLAPTIALVHQQAEVIEKSLDFKVGVHCGDIAHAWNHQHWEKQIEEHEVLVVTPQLMLHYLAHCFIKMEQIALLIFDECHYAQLDCAHPYAEIMKVFYKVGKVKLPRVFGMTASPKLGKGGSIDGLEAIMHSKVCTIEDKDEVEKYVTSPKAIAYEYGSTEKRFLCRLMVCTTKLEEIKDKCMLGLGYNKVDQSTRNLLQKLHTDMTLCLENLGIWGALQATYVSLAADNYEIAELVEAVNSCSDFDLWKKYLHEISSVLASDCSRGGLEVDNSCIKVLEEPFFSAKILQLIEILSSFRLTFYLFLNNVEDTKFSLFLSGGVRGWGEGFRIHQLSLVSGYKEYTYFKG